MRLEKTREREREREHETQREREYGKYHFSSYGSAQSSQCGRLNFTKI